MKQLSILFKAVVFFCLWAFIVTNSKSYAQCSGTVLSLSAPTPSQTGTSGSWTVPGSGFYKVKITAKGAKGGDGSTPGFGGNGASLTGNFIVASGQILQSTAGAPGGNGISFGSIGSGGGGGGSGVQLSSGQVLIVSGGGGGGGFSFNGNGGGGILSAGSGNGGNGFNGAGGGGFLSQGGVGFTNCGAAPTGGGFGYNASGGAGKICLAFSGNGGGGFGGGGGGNAANISGGGGGGGFSGGNGGALISGSFLGGDGGSSINYGSAQVNTANDNNGGGSVLIECLGPAIYSSTIEAQSACGSNPNGSLSIDLTGDINSNTSGGVEYAIVSGSSFSGNPVFNGISADPFIISSGFGTAVGTYTVRVRLTYNPAIFTDYSYTISASVIATWYLDSDKDGYYTGSPVTSCSSPGNGYTTNITAAGDCDDNNAAINPDATEVCNGRDDDCDGQTDEGTNLSPTIIANGPLTFCNSSNVTLTAALGNNALQLNGINQYVITPSLTPAFLNKNSFTIELWFKANGGGVLVTELGQNAINIGYHASAIEILSNGTVIARAWNMIPITLGTISFGSWNHVALRYNAANTRLEGALNGTMSTASSSGNRQSPSDLGLNQYWAFGATTVQNLGNGSYFNGSIDEIRIWDTAISNVQIAANYNKTVSGNAKGLVAYYKLDESTASIATDASGNSNDAAIMNNPVPLIPADNSLNSPGYLWSVTNATTQAITTNTGGSYNVQVTVSANCNATSADVILNIGDSIIYVNTAAPAGGNGNSWATAYNDLQAALAAVSTCTKQVWVAAGTYKPTTGTDRSISFVMRNGVSILGGFPNTGNPGLGDRNWAANPTILSGDIGTVGDNSDNSFHVIFNNNGLNSTAILNGFTISGGNANDNTGTNKQGGGMYNESSSPSVINCTFSGNSANFGGGMYNNSSSPMLTKCNITGNSATDGAGIFNFSSSPIVTNCSFIGNTAIGIAGGMFNGGNSSAIVTNCSFYGNTANIGGGITNDGSSPIITNTTFSGNSAGNNGGAILNFGATATPILKNSILWGNSNNGLVNSGGANPTVTYSIVQGGYAGTGNLDMNPAFVNAAGGNLRLQACSPAINTGDNAAVPSGVSTDLDGNPRFYALGVVDLGAYELQQPGNSAILYVKANATGANNGSSWNDAFTDLQSAFASNCLGVTQIWVAAGTYKPTTGSNRSISFSMRNGVAILGGFPNTGNPGLSDRNWTANPTILSGDIGTVGDRTDNSYRIIFNNGLNNSAVLDGFTIRDAYNTSGFNGTEGGGMRNQNASPLIVNCLFQNNNINTSGGGVANFSSSPIFANCLFIENSAKSGGAIFTEDGNPILTNCTLVRNNAFNTTNAGGGIGNNLSNSTTIVKNGIIWGNTPDQVNNNQNSNTTITYSIVQGGYAGTGNLDVNPVFVNAVSGNLRLQACSPAINMGDPNTTTAMAGTVDLDGNPRFFNSGVVDMGAYEFQGNPATFVVPPVTTNNGLHFDGTDDCVEITNCPSAPFANGGDAITIEYWFKGSYIQSAVRFQVGGNWIVAGWNGQHIISTDGGTNGISVGTAATDGNWHHVAMTWQRNTTNGFKSYLDGQLVEQRNTPDVSLPSISGGMYLGAWDGASEFMNGTLDEVRVWNVARTQAQLQAWLCNELSLPQAGLLMYYKFNHGIANGNNAGINALANSANATGNVGILRNFALSGNSSNWVAPKSAQLIRYVKQGGTGSGTSWADASGDLQAMIDICNVQQVWVAAGTYKPTTGTDRSISFVMRNGVSILGGFPNTGNPGLSDRNRTANVTILSGDIGAVGDNADNTFNIVRNIGNSLNSTAILDGLVIENGNASGGNEPTGYGGGIYNNNSSPTVNNCVFRNNSCNVSGGAMYNTTGSSATINNCAFINNITLQTGGGIYNNFSSPSIVNCSFFGNSGQGIMNVSNSNTQITNCIFWGNSSGIANVLNSYPTVTYSIVQGGHPGTGNLDVDPAFVNAAGGNLRLQTCSPATNAGDNTAVPSGITIDIDGNPRIVGGNVDMGAYENPGGAAILAQLTADPSVIPAFTSTNTYSTAQKLKLIFSPAGGVLSVLSGPGVIGTGDTLSFTGAGTVVLQYNSTNCGNPNSTQISLQASAGTLPLHLLTFNASMNNCKTLLSWQTGFEQNTDRFEIEQSTTGTNWQQAGTIAALNNTQGGTYSFTVQPHGEHVMFYRLKMVDKDDSYTYSKTITNKNNCAGSETVIRVLPNPVSGSTATIIVYGDYRGRAMLTLFNGLGQKIVTKEINVRGSGVAEHINIPGVTPGQYLVQLTDWQGKTLCSAQKLLKQ